MAPAGDLGPGDVGVDADDDPAAQGSPRPTLGRVAAGVAGANAFAFERSLVPKQSEGERVIVVINRGDVIERLVLPVQAERTEVLWGQAQVGLDGGDLLLRVDAQSGVVVRV